MIHTNLPYGELIFPTRLQNRPRQPDVIVEIAFCFRDAVGATENRGGKIFGRGLAIAAGDAEDLQRQSFSIFGSQVLVSGERVVAAKNGKLLRQPGRNFLCHDRACSAGFCHLFEKVVCVEIFTAQSNEQFARLDRARIRADALDCCLGRSASDFCAREFCDVR